jgi:hypothetical protein
MVTVKPKYPPPGQRPVARHNPAGKLTQVFVDQRTGKEYTTRAQLRKALRHWNLLVLRDFEELVRERTLGQPAWDNLPGETPLAFSRFRSFLTMTLGPKGERSIHRLAASLGLTTKGILSTYTKYHWQLRAKLWDQHLLDEEDIQFSKERKMSARRQARLGLRLQSVANTALGQLAADPDRIAAMTPIEILKMSESGQRVERLAHGDATVVTDRQVQLVWDGPKPTWAPEQQEPEPLPLDDGKTIEGQH